MTHPVLATNTSCRSGHHIRSQSPQWSLWGWRTPRKSQWTKLQSGFLWVAGQEVDHCEVAESEGSGIQCVTCLLLNIFPVHTKHFTSNSWIKRFSLLVVLMSKDTLPTKNEEYGTQAYWCFVKSRCLIQLLIDHAGNKDTHSLFNSFYYKIIPSDPSIADRGKVMTLTGLNLTGTWPNCYTNSFQRNHQKLSCSDAETQSSLKTCVVSKWWNEFNLIGFGD